MKNCFAKFILSLVLFSVWTGAHAEADPGDWYWSAMMSYIDDDEDRLVDDGLYGTHIGIGKAISNFNIEAYFAHAAPSGPNRQTQLSGGVDLQLLIGRENKITPYVFAGVGYMSVNPEAAATDQGATYAGGVGLFADIFGSSNAAMRLEYRYRQDEVFSDSLSDQMVSLGVHVPFGGRSAPMAVPAREPEPEPDGDGDGVPDSRDRCPDTPAGVQVNSSGCAPDGDGDGVPDHRDECPNTPGGASVDANGCETDGDSDGVVDSQDQCPNSRAGAQVDINGCEIREEIQLPGVNFETNSDRLVAGTEGVLRDAAATLQRNPTIRVEVAGHTDSDGAAEYNESLSQRRAETVRDFLISQGVAADRLTALGYGESAPIADNGTAAGKAQNRRVVLRVLER